jgi:hypothetical protein
MDGLPALARRSGALRAGLPTVSPHLQAITVAAAALAFLAALTYYASGTFTGQAADRRGAAEAQSLARLSGRLATADAYNAYLEMLRYAADPAVRAPATRPDVRRAAMQQLLYVNTNNLSTLIVADRSGLVIASTDPAILDVRDSTAFQDARSTFVASNSDVIFPPDGGRGYVDFATPLTDAAGTTWAILVGRADPARLWAPMLLSQADASRSVVISGDGRIAAGVPDPLLGRPWQGQPLPGDSVRTPIDGHDSICGLSPIGQGSRIDRGFTVATCLPASVIEGEQRRALDRQAIVTAAGLVLALVLAAAALVFANRRPRPLLMLAAPHDGEAEERPEAAEPMAPPPSEPDGPPTGAEAPAMPPAVDVDAAALIEAYERRNERIAELLREDLRARLLVSGTQAAEAFRRASPDDDEAVSLHAQALEELEGVRDRELRRIEQELYPAVVRLGLPNALKALRRDLAGDIDLTLELDPLADALDEDEGRAAIDVPRRVVLYRFVLETARALAEAGATSAFVTLSRRDGEISLCVTSAEASVEEPAFDASRLALEAYGGGLELSTEHGFAATAAFQL